jgi:hypothetical protein
MSLRFLLGLTDGVTSSSSTDGVSGAPLPSLLYRGYLTKAPHSNHATLSAGREASGLAPLLARLALLGGESHHGTPPLWAHAPALPPHPTQPYRGTVLPYTNPYGVTIGFGIALPNTTAALWPNMDGLYQTPRRYKHF